MNRQRPDRATLILLLLLIIPVIWAAVLAAPLLAEGLPGLIKGLPGIDPANVTWTADTPRTILIFLLAYGMGLMIYYSTRRNYRRLEEHGSARWGDAAALCRKYRDRKSPNQNKLLTQNVSIGLNGRKHRRNLNTLVIGGSGAGKTRFFCKPNVMQANTSFVILDPKGEILRDTGYLLEKKGYVIKVLDLIDMGKSHGYNPFAYIRDENDVLKLVTNLIRNTTPKGSQSNDPFWERSETALLQALILYLVEEAPPDEQNFPMVMEMVAASGASEGEEAYESIIDELFARLAMDRPESVAVKQYGIYKQAPGKTAKSILISLGVRLEKFNLPQIASVVSHDELNLPSLGDKKTALFAVIPDNDSSLNYIIGMMYTQLFQELFFKADQLHGGRLPVHVHCVMDEFANVALPDEFDKLLSTMRSREVSVSIIIQNLAQLKALFEKQWESIVGNCDEFLYLGGNEQSTHKYVSELLGKSTMDVNTYGQSKGRNGSYSTNWQISGRELYTPDEVRMLDNRYALLFIRGERAVQDDKYNILRHPNIKLTADGGVEPYIHGQAPNALDPDFILLDGDMGDYELLSETDVEELLKKSETEEQKK